MSTREEMENDAKADAWEEKMRRTPCPECRRYGGEHQRGCPDAPDEIEESDEEEDES